MSPITTHVLDTSRGRPAIGVEVILQIRSGREWKQLGAGLTDANGRRIVCFSTPALITKRSIRKLFIRKFQSFLKFSTLKLTTTSRF